MSIRHNIYHRALADAAANVWARKWAWAAIVLLNVGAWTPYLQRTWKIGAAALATALFTLDYARRRKIPTSN